MKKFITTMDICNKYGVTLQAVSKWRKYNGLPYEKLGYRTFRYDIDKFEEWIANNKKGRV